MPQVLMNFQHHKTWSVHFIEADCRTRIGQRTKFYSFATLESLRAFVMRCFPEGASLEEFEMCVSAWGRGSLFVNLSDEQYGKLRQGR